MSVVLPQLKPNVPSQFSTENRLSLRLVAKQDSADFNNLRETMYQTTGSNKALSPWDDTTPPETTNKKKKSIAVGISASSPASKLKKH